MYCWHLYKMEHQSVLMTNSTFFVLLDQGHPKNICFVRWINQTRTTTYGKFKLNFTLDRVMFDMPRFGIALDSIYINQITINLIVLVVRFSKLENNVKLSTMQVNDDSLLADLFGQLFDYTLYSQLCTQYRKYVGRICYTVRRPVYTSRKQLRNQTDGKYRMSQLIENTNHSTKDCDLIAAWVLRVIFKIW